MLSQLSYIPGGGPGPERGPLWTRTTDLTVISRALLPPELKAPGARAAQPRGPDLDGRRVRRPRGAGGAVPARASRRVVLDP